MSDQINPDDYEEPKRRKSERRQRGVIVSVRLTSAELEAIQRLADQKGMLVSTYLRERALAVDPPLLTLPAASATLIHRWPYRSVQVDCSNR